MQVWSDVTLAALERKGRLFFQRSPQAFFWTVSNKQPRVAARRPIGFANYRRLRNETKPNNSAGKGNNPKRTKMPLPRWKIPNEPISRSWSKKCPHSSRPLVSHHKRQRKTPNDSLKNISIETVPRSGPQNDRSATCSNREHILQANLFVSRVPLISTFGAWPRV